MPIVVRWCPVDHPVRAAAKEPVSCHDDIGFDLVYTGDPVIVPSYTVGSDHIVKLGTGLCVEAPPWCYARIAPRSGLSLKGIIVNGGVVDPGYTGEISCIIMNMSGHDYQFMRGDRIAQLIFENAVGVRDGLEFQKVDSLSKPSNPCTTTSDQARLDKGFGSSGR